MSESWLGDYLSAKVAWRAVDTPMPDSDMTELLATQWDINKFAHYIPVYEKVFAPYRDQPVRMLEIGVNLGGSIELWRKYFRHPDTQIVGIDLHPGCAKLDDPANNVHVRIGAQQDWKFLQELVSEFGPFDIILDDGSHIPSFTLKSFQFLFARGLWSPGAYLVEDLFSCYMPDGLEPFGIPEADDGSPSFIDFAKSLIDVLHEIYLQTPSGQQVADAFEPGNAKQRSEFQVSLACKTLSSLEFYDSIVVIRKGTREVPRTIRRWSPERLTSVLGWKDSKVRRLWAQYPNLKPRKDWASTATSMQTGRSDDQR